MTTALIDTCPLCGLRFSNRPLLELHLREDHRRPPPRRKGKPGDGNDEEAPEEERTNDPVPAHAARRSMFAPGRPSALAGGQSPPSVRHRGAFTSRHIERLLILSGQVERSVGLRGGAPSATPR